MIKIQHWFHPLQDHLKVFLTFYTQYYILSNQLYQVLSCIEVYLHPQHFPISYFSNPPIHISKMDNFISHRKIVSIYRFYLTSFLFYFILYLLHQCLANLIVNSIIIFSVYFIDFLKLYILPLYFSFLMSIRLNFLLSLCCIPSALLALKLSLTSFSRILHLKLFLKYFIFIPLIYLLDFIQFFWIKTNS